MRYLAGTHHYDHLTYRLTEDGEDAVLNQVVEDVEQMLTVVGTLRRQRRNLWAYLVQTCQAAVQGQPAPSLLP